MAYLNEARKYFLFDIAYTAYSDEIWIFFLIMFNFSAYCSLSSDFSGGKQVKIVFKALKNDEILPAKMY